jgi:predicted aspartyl protease
MPRLRIKEDRSAFLKKSSKKLLPTWRRPSRIRAAQTRKSFLVLFFKKELLISFLAATPASATCTMSHFADVSATLYQNKLFLPVTMNGIVEKLAMDTGASSTILSTDAARRLNIPHDFDQTVEMLGVGGADNHLYSGQVETMEFAGQHFDGLHLAIADFRLPLANGEEMGGLLGADILSQFDVDIDIPHRTVGFWRVSGCSQVVPPWSAVSSELPLTRIGINHMALPIAVDGVPVQVMLDTGAPDLVLTELQAARAGASLDSLRGGRAIVGHGVNDREYVGHVHVFQTVRVGRASYQEVIAEVVPRARLQSFEGLLGLAFLLQHRIWLSYATNTLFIEAAPAPP